MVLLCPISLTVCLSLAGRVVKLAMPSHNQNGCKKNQSTLLLVEPHLLPRQITSKFIYYFLTFSDFQANIWFV